MEGDDSFECNRPNKRRAVAISAKDTGGDTLLPPFAVSCEEVGAVAFDAEVVEGDGADALVRLSASSAETQLAAAGERLSSFSDKRTCRTPTLFKIKITLLLMFCLLFTRSQLPRLRSPTCVARY